MTGEWRTFPRKSSVSSIRIGHSWKPSNPLTWRKFVGGVLVTFLFVSLGVGLETLGIIPGKMTAYSATTQVLIQDGFESGSFQAWSGKVTTSADSASVSSANVYEGAFAASFMTGPVASGTRLAYCYKTILPVLSEIYVRGYFFISKGQPLNDNDDRFGLIGYEVGGKLQCSFRVLHYGGVDRFNVVGFNGSSSVVSQSTNAIYPVQGRWFEIELYTKVDATAGEYRAWINGVQQIAITRVNTAGFGSGVSKVRFGLTSTIGVQNTVQVQFDSAVISTAFVSQHSEGLTLYSSRNPSHIKETIKIYGKLTTALTSPSNQTVTLQYSKDSSFWVNLSRTTTDNNGYFSLQVVPAYKGLLHFRAVALSKTATLEQAIGDYIVATDGSGDYSDVYGALKALPSTGGVLCFKKGDYSMQWLINLTGRSNLSLIGTGYDTKIYKTRGVTLKIANASNILIENLHFHHLTNDAFTPIRVEGNNKNIFIRMNWFTREDGPPLVCNDVLWTDITSRTENLVIEECYFEKAQADAIALKNVVNGVVRNNTIKDAASAFGGKSASGITLEKCTNLTISRNLFTRTGTQKMVGISVFGGSKTVNIADNDVINMDCLAINLGPASDIYVARNHIIDPHGISIRIGDVIAITIRSNYLRVTQPDRVNASGVHVTASRNVTITENVVTGTQRGFVIVDTISVTLTNNNVDCAAKQLEQDMNGILILSCSQAKLINNTVLNARYFGLTIGKSPDTIVSLNTVQRSMLSGIHIWSCNGSVIQRNIAANNGQYQFSYDRQGIALSSSFNCTIDGNRGFDGQLTKTQSYGFVEKGTSDYNTVTNNDFRYNRVGAMRIIGMHTVAKNNLG